MTSTIRKKIGSKIKKLRLEQGYTQAQLAEKVGIDYKYLQKVEGPNTPDLKIDTIQKIAKALKVKVSDLVEG